MTLTDADVNQIARLVREGKQIKDVWLEDFPDLEYDEVYWAARGSGARSALGVKRRITSRLRKAARARTQQTRSNLIEEIDDLVTALYEDHKRMATKLRSIRRALSE